MTNTITPHI